MSTSNLLETMEIDHDFQETRRSRPRKPHLLEYTSKLEIQRTLSGEPQEYGRGAWSAVYKAFARSQDAPQIGLGIGLPTPPTSPESAPQLLAVKAPLRRDAHAVLRDEALTLSHVGSIPDHEEHVVPFYGFLSSTDSLVLQAVPLTLSSYVEGATASNIPSTSTMFDPIIGMRAWKSLAQQLIGSIAWLHGEAGVVHGDIKPQNVLLRPYFPVSQKAAENTFPFTPLFADFSSSYVLSQSEPSPSALSALTAQYTAPEILAALTKPHLSSVPTPASDVFSLAVTLVAVATGDLRVYPATSEMQRLYMAKSDGYRVLDHVRNGPQGSRVPRRGMVEQIVEKAVLKDGMGRVDAMKWVEVVEAVYSEGPQKKAPVKKGWLS